jgi:hypothetical protein
MATMPQARSAAGAAHDTIHPPFFSGPWILVAAYRTKKKKPAGMTRLALSDYLGCGAGRVQYLIEHPYGVVFAGSTAVPPVAAVSAVRT